MMCQARAVEGNELKEPSTMKITTVGLDIAKRVFQLHGVDVAHAPEAGSFPALRHQLFLYEQTVDHLSHQPSNRSLANSV